MTALDRIMNTPIIRLSMAEIDGLSEDDRTRVFGKLFDMARDGDLAMLAVNPPGTTYEVGLNGGKWALLPVCQCHNQPRFIEAYFEFHGDGQCPKDPEK